MKKQKRNTSLYKIINHKRRPICDYQGSCNNLAYREVYPMLLKGKYSRRGWSYLCRKHFQQEQKRFKNKLPYAPIN
jgi:hypothetical protein